MDKSQELSRWVHLCSLLIYSSTRVVFPFPLFPPCPSLNMFSPPYIGLLKGTLFLFLLPTCNLKRIGRQGSYVELPPGISLPGLPYLKDKDKGGRTYIKYGKPGESNGDSAWMDIGKDKYALPDGIAPLAPPRLTPGVNKGGSRPGDKMINTPSAALAQSMSNALGSVPSNMNPVFLSNSTEYIARLHEKMNQQDMNSQLAAQGSTFAQLGGGQFFQSLFGGKGGFSPLSFFLGNRGGTGGFGNAPFFIPVPIVVPPPPPPPPGPECYTNKSGFLCCNVTLEMTMEKAYTDFKAEGFSNCNVQKMASVVGEAAEKKFGTPFESVAAHKDFVAKINFAGDLNCKIEIDGKFILAYATPLPEKEVNIIDANSFFSGDASELLESGNGTDTDKPTYIVYGPIR